MNMMGPGYFPGDMMPQLGSLPPPPGGRAAEFDPYSPEMAGPMPSPGAPQMPSPYDYGTGQPGVPLRAPSPLAPAGALPPQARKPGAGAQVADAVEDQGLDLDKLLKEAAARQGEAVPKGLSRADKGGLLMELGMRMMALSGQPGANTAGSFGQAALGALGSRRALEERKRTEAERRSDKAIDYAIKRDEAKARREERAERHADRRDARDYRKSASNRPVAREKRGGVLYNIYAGDSAKPVREEGGLPFRPDAMTADKIVAARQRALQNLAKRQDYMIVEDPGERQRMEDDEMERVLAGVNDSGLEPIGMSE